ncbi:MAG TPA: metallophosphoesterase [Opitutaceae bacterium]|nr:metallophosphoesterase [Opitutaceae bacterium]
MSEFLRIFSDVHYGDRASQARSLVQLAPLLHGPASLVLNGDTLETRPGPAPERTAAMLAEVQAFFPRHTPKVTFLTGNHDANLTTHHLLELAGGEIFVTHGDILYDDLVPWSQDAPAIRHLLATEFSTIPAAQHDVLETRLALYRRVATSIPQRHQSERNPFKYAIQFANDTVWPPMRLVRILRSWREMPELAAALIRRHRPRTKFIIIGHTHRPGVWRQPDGRVVINTGSFSRPFGGCIVDVFPGRLFVRRIEARRGEFHPGATIAEFALADAGALTKTHRHEH